MPALQFPSSPPYESEIPNWLQIKIHKPVSDPSQQGNQMGDLVKEIMIVAPQIVVENNTANYTSTDFKISSALADAGISWVEAMKGAAKVAIESLPGIGSEFARMMGQITNPRSEMFYSGPGFRQFTFHWELAPLTSVDAKGLQEIYRTIRKFSYPELSSSKMGYKMPHEFKLAFVSQGGGGSMAMTDPKFGKCVVTNLALNYTGAGINAVNDGGGAPPFLNMDITFAERVLQNQTSDPIDF